MIGHSLKIWSMTKWASRGAPPPLTTQKHTPNSKGPCLPWALRVVVPWPISLSWLSDTVIWVEQWSIIEPKIAALKELVNEQVRLGCSAHFLLCSISDIPQYPFQHRLTFTCKWIDVSGHSWGDSNTSTLFLASAVFRNFGVASYSSTLAFFHAYKTIARWMNLTSAAASPGITCHGSGEYFLRWWFSIRAFLFPV